LQDPPKFTQIVIFGLKMCHLATLHLATPRQGKMSQIGKLIVAGKKSWLTSSLSTMAIFLLLLGTTTAGIRSLGPEQGDQMTWRRNRPKRSPMWK
jgi:hypothetical protein